MRTEKSLRVLLAGVLIAAALMPAPAMAAPVKLAATLSGGVGGDPDGSGTFTVDVDPDLGDFCYVLNVAKVAKITGAAVQAAASPDPVVKLEVQGTSADECIAGEPAALKPIVENPAGYVVVIKTADFPAGAVQGALGKK